MEPFEKNKLPYERRKKGTSNAGRKTEYNEETATEICTRISCGESLRQICKDPHMPSQSAIYYWLFQNKQFAEKYAQARDEQADTLADEIHAISDEEPREVVDDKGIARVDSGWVTWQKNRVDARKWVASKLKPKKYGDRTTVAGDAENPLAVSVDTTIFDKILQNVEMTKQVKGK